MKEVGLKSSLVCGAVAGSTELLCMYPLDTIKTWLQLNASKTKISLLNIPLKHFYRGILSPLCVEPLKRSVKFASNDLYKRLFKSIGFKEGVGLSSFVGLCAGLTEGFVGFIF